jgi:hypothetical protein
MSYATLSRFCAGATILGGIGEIAITTLDFLAVPQGAFSDQVASSAWSAEQVLNWVAKVLLLFALIGLYGRQAPEAGRFGLIAFVVAFTGTAFEFATIWGFYILAQVLVTAAPQVLDSLIDLLPVQFGVFVPFLWMSLGWPLFALASLRAKVLPRLGFVLIAIGPLLFLVGLRHVPDVVFGAGLIAAGSALWTTTTAPARLEGASAAAAGV